MKHAWGSYFPIGKIDIDDKKSQNAPVSSMSLSSKNDTGTRTKKNDKNSFLINRGTC